jgi:hypothetical protein
VQFRDFKLQAGLEQLKQWWAALASRESVRAIAKAPELYIETYARHEQTMKALIYGNDNLCFKTNF